MTKFNKALINKDGEYVTYGADRKFIARFKHRDHINSCNKPLEKGEIAPDWYMIAEQEIRVVEK